MCKFHKIKSRCFTFSTFLALLTWQSAGFVIIIDRKKNFIDWWTNEMHSINNSVVFFCWVQNIIASPFMDGWKTKRKPRPNWQFRSGPKEKETIKQQWKDEKKIYYATQMQHNEKSPWRLHFIIKYFSHLGVVFVSISYRMRFWCWFQ